ncbi:hypothetical protein KR009_004621 [Drosophila setifemur]|nr:hypothetical protein KR009_004621 [Drosophila setifemur]
MDIFDMVKAAPPPQRITLAEQKNTPSPIPPDSPLDPIDSDDLLDSGSVSKDLLKDSDEEDDKCQKEKDDESPFKVLKLQEESPFKVPKKHMKRKAQTNESLLEEEKKDDGQSPFKLLKKRATKPIDTADANEEKDSSSSSSSFSSGKKGKRDSLSEAEKSDEENHLHSTPTKTYLNTKTKTKAQQKMFNDSMNFERECCVRIRRLTREEIVGACESVSASSFASVSPKRRGRPRKSPGEAKKQQSPRVPSPTKKTKVHVRVPLLQNGAKKRSFQNLSRAHTPPPSLSPRSAGKHTPMLKSKLQNKLRAGSHVSQALIRRFGVRFFRCVVKIKRTNWPSHQPQPLVGSATKKSGRSRKSNLSVSFSEAVEILGSNEGSSRRTKFGSSNSASPKAPKPTRLQRVDDKGNVLEDIALTSSSSLRFSTGSLPASSGKSKRRSCNGSPMVPRLKRPLQRLPLSGLASLRLDDDSEPGEEEDPDAEYIVPNELPGIQRPGTPTPKKRELSFTTTISDNEDEIPIAKKRRDSTKREHKLIKESSIKRAKEKYLEQKKAHESERPKDILRDPKIRADFTRESIKSPEKPELQSDKKRPEEAETNEDEVEESPEKVDEAGEENAEEEGGDAAEEKKVEVNSKDAIANPEPINESEKTLDLEREIEGEPNEEAEPELGLDADAEADAEVGELEQTSAPVVMSSDDQEEDVLEIQTSLDDVRELHTPSSRQSTPPLDHPAIQLQLECHDSAESECSYKSASPNVKSRVLLSPADHVEAAEESAIPPEEILEAAAEEEEEAASALANTIIPSSDPHEMPSELIALPTDVGSVNGSEPIGGSNVSIPAPFYSTIEAMPTLDDEVLGQLVEPDFQLNSSRHALSRGTLDDIMTALES